MHEGAPSVLLHTRDFVPNRAAPAVSGQVWISSVTSPAAVPPAAAHARGASCMNELSFEIMRRRHDCADNQCTKGTVGTIARAYAEPRVAPAVSG